MRPLLKNIKSKKSIRHEKLYPWGYWLSVSFYIDLRKCAAALPATAQQETVKAGTLSVKEPNRRDGTANPSKGAWQASDLRATVRVRYRQRRNTYSPICCRTDQRTRAIGDKTSPVAAKLKRLCPPQFLRTGIFPYAAFVLNVAKVKRDRKLAEAKKSRNCRGFRHRQASDSGEIDWK